MLTLYRYHYGDDATLGVLADGDGYICDTLELPWKYNVPFESCIPEGEYELEYREDNEHRIKRAYIVKDVLNRTDILIHTANAVSELKGCIAVGIKNGSHLSDSFLSFSQLKERAKLKSALRIYSLK